MDAAAEVEPVGGSLGRIALAARFHVRSARRKVASNDVHVRQEAAIYAGIGVELLARAALLAVDRDLLLGAPDDLHHALLERVLRGGSLPARKQRPKSVAASVALALVHRMDPGFGSIASLNELLRLRNGAAHMAEQVDAARLAELLVDLEFFATRVFGALRAQIGDVLRTVEYEEWTLRHAEREAEARADAQRRVIAARQQYERLVSGLSVEKVEAIDRLLLARANETPNGQDVEVRTGACPACSFEGGYVEFVLDVECDHREGTVVGGGYYASHFQCPRCGLRLDAGQLDSVGIEESYCGDDYDDWRD